MEKSAQSKITLLEGRKSAVLVRVDVVAESLAVLVLIVILELKTRRLLRYCV